MKRSSGGGSRSYYCCTALVLTALYWTELLFRPVLLGIYIVCYQGPGNESLNYNASWVFAHCYCPIYKPDTHG